MVKTCFTYNLDQEEGVEEETCRNADMAWKLRATGSEEAGFKEKLIQVEGLHIFNFEVLISKKISWTVNGMHPHGNAAAHVPAPLPSKEGPAPHLREKGQRHQGLTAFFKASLLLPVNQISPPQLTARVLRERSQRRGSQTPGAPHTSGRQKVRRANLSSSGSSV